MRRAVHDENLLLYHGVLFGNARLRARAVAHGRPESAAEQSGRTPPRGRKRPNPTWAELMRRGLDLDVLECPRCGARMALVASILNPTVARRILEHLALPSEPALTDERLARLCPDHR